MSRNDDRVDFNITYYPVLKNFRILLEELDILLVPDEQLVMSVLSKIDVASNSGPCCRKKSPCELCKLMKKIQLSKSKILT